jgi:hypothetical protein
VRSLQAGAAQKPPLEPCDRQGIADQAHAVTRDAIARSGTDRGSGESPHHAPEQRRPAGGTEKGAGRAGSLGAPSATIGSSSHCRCARSARDVTACEHPARAGMGAVATNSSDKTAAIGKGPRFRTRSFFVIPCFARSRQFIARSTAPARSARKLRSRAARNSAGQVDAHKTPAGHQGRSDTRSSRLCWKAPGPTQVLYAHSKTSPARADMSGVRASPKRAGRPPN